MCEKEGIFSKIFDMFVWTSGFQKSLARTDFRCLWTSANESPVEVEGKNGNVAITTL